MGSDTEGRATAAQAGASETAPAATTRAIPERSRSRRHRVATVHPNGSIRSRGTIFSVSDPLRGQDVYVVYEAAGLMVFDDRGTLIAEHLWPPGVKYIGNGQPPLSKKKEASPMS